MTDIQTREQRSPAQDLVARVRGDEFKSQIALALPEGIASERFVRLTVTALLQNPLIADADPDSIFSALLRAAQDGLVPDGREAALVPFKGRAQYLPMIGGFRKLAGEHGWALQTACVYAGDEFEYETGLEAKLRHVPSRPGVEKGDIVAAYCVARHRSGERLVEVMYRDELDKIRGKSAKANSGPWVEWPERMYEKTVGKRAFAKLPLYGTDEELERIRRLLADTADDPAQAQALYYGTTSARMLPAATPASPSPGDDTAVAVYGPQDDAAAPSLAAASSPGTSVDDEPEPGDTARVGAEDDQLVKLAASTLVPSGKRQGQSLAEVAVDGADGFGWIVWAMGPARAWNKQESEFGTALRVFVKHRLPDAAEAAAAKYSEAA